MKRVLILVTCLVLAGLAWAGGITRLSQIGPASSSSQVAITGVSGQKNCITDVDVTVNAGATFVILAGGTTAYAVDLSSGGGLVRSWDDEDAPCGSSGQAVYLNVTAGAQNRINYGGYAR